jgi:hypothetical protein
VGRSSTRDGAGRASRGAVSVVRGEQLSQSRMPGIPSGDFDQRALVVDERTFALAAELEVRRAIRLQYYVSVLAVQADTDDPAANVDWTEVHGRIAEIIREEIRNTDLISTMPTSPRVWVLLASPGLESLPAIIGRITGAVNGRSFATDGSEVHVALSLGGSCFPTTARDRAELFRQAELLSVEAHAQPGDLRHRYRLAPPVS